MSLTLYFHPLSNFCQKALIALYENGTPFKPHLVDLGDEKQRAEFKKIWPVGKFPVLRDDANGKTIPESSMVIEYLDVHFPGKTKFVPVDAELARQVRQSDRFYDWYMNLQTQKIVTDRFRPADKSDSIGVEQARTLMQTALGIVDKEMAAKTWAVGDAFSMADCAAAPTLFYANMVMPFADTHKNAAKYLDRLMQRPSYARALAEAKPYLSLVPAAPNEGAKRG